MSTYYDREMAQHKFFGLKKKHWIILTTLSIVVVYLALFFYTAYNVCSSVFRIKKAIHEKEFSSVEQTLPALQKNLLFMKMFTIGKPHAFYALTDDAVLFAEQSIEMMQQGQLYVRAVMQGRVVEAQNAYQSLYSSAINSEIAFQRLNANIKKHASIQTYISHKFPLYETIVSKTFPTIQTLLKIVPSFFGPQHKTYLVLLQNTMELRPTGGFLGSFAMLNFDNGVLSSMKVEDIYVPDGQLQSYVKPPKPVEEYLFQKGGWKLRDSNWDPNFPEAAKTIAWFFDKGGYHNVDGVVTVNFSLVQRILQVIGPLYLPDYNQTISAENIYSFTQVNTEKNFFPGATNKESILGGLARALMRRLEELSSKEQLAIAHTMFEALQTKDVMMWMHDPVLQTFIER